MLLQYGSTGGDVEQVQTYLTALGYDCGPIDGVYGGATVISVRVFQRDQSLVVDGVTGDKTYAALIMAYRAAPILPGFRGNLSIVHDWEGHRGRAYWPGAQSGVTLDPGVDLAHFDQVLLDRLYRPILTADQLAACRRMKGLVGRNARIALAESPVLQSIRISLQQADEVFPYAARPYWEDMAKRFKAIMIEGVPGAVHTVFLSLSYNRGAMNEELDVLKKPVEAHDWGIVADLIGGMQQDHELEGIRERRRDEAELIRIALG